MGTIISVVTNHLHGKEQDNLPMSDIPTNELASTKNTPIVVLIFHPVILPRESVEVPLSRTTPIHVPLQLFFVQRCLSEQIKNRLVLVDFKSGNRVGYFLQLTKVEDSLIERFANERKVSLKLFHQGR